MTAEILVALFLGALILMLGVGIFLSIGSTAE